MGMPSQEIAALWRRAPNDAQRFAGPTQPGVICDQRVMLNGYYSAKKYPEHLRRIRFKASSSPLWVIWVTPMAPYIPFAHEGFPC